METTRPAPPRSSLVVAVAVAAALVLAACTDSDPSTVESGDGGGDGAAPGFSFQPLDPGAITVTALEQGSIDIAVLFSTNAAIAANDWVVLEDDKELQGAENIVPLVRTEVVNGPAVDALDGCLLYTSPSPRDRQKSRMPSSA